MMFLQRIQRNKLLQVVISVILCIVLMFCIVSKPFEVKVNAIAGLDDAIFWAIVSALLQFGIVIEVSNPEAQQAVSDFFWSLTDQLRSDIETAAALWRQGYSVYYDWAVESWSNIAHAIANWFTTDRYSQSSIIYGGVYASNNSVDFRVKDSITFNFPHIDNNVEAVVYFPFNDCQAVYYCNASIYTEYSLRCVNSSGVSTTFCNGVNVVCIQPNDYDFYLYSYFYGTNLSEYSIKNHAVEVSHINGTYYPRFYFYSPDIDFSGTSVSNTSFPFIRFDDTSVATLLISAGHSYSYVRFSNNKYGFYCFDNGGTYNNWC